MITLFGCAHFFNFVSYLLYPIEVKRLKCALLGAFIALGYVIYDNAHPNQVDLLFDSFFLRLFLMAPWFGLQCVIVVFPGHTNLLFYMKQNRKTNITKQRTFHPVQGRSQRLYHVEAPK